MTEMLKTLPLGVENFTEIINNNLYYVDKTPLIRDILQDGAKITLFTRPRRFGKTLMMSMLHSFFEVGTDPALFDGLAIADEKVLCEQYLGKYPVISVSLKDVHIAVPAGQQGHNSRPCQDIMGGHPQKQ
jgi:hypothetical protein